MKNRDDRAHQMPIGTASNKSRTKVVGMRKWNSPASRGLLVTGRAIPSPSVNLGMAILHLVNLGMTILHLSTTETPDSMDKLDETSTPDQVDSFTQ